MAAAIQSLQVVQSTPVDARPAEARRATLGSTLQFIAHEPFFQFIALGLVLWGCLDYWNVHHDRYTIHIGLSQRQRIADVYRQQFGQAPTPDQLQSLIDRYIREEIYLREGLAINLDKDDEIVRRRIIQKYAFLRTDLAQTGAPVTEVLERWFAKNQSRFRRPERVAFSQIYFAAGPEGEQAARSRALDVLQRLNGARASRVPGVGDAFPGPADPGALTAAEAGRLFGRSELSDRLFNIAAGRWAGPYRSGYGWHLVYIKDRVPSAMPSLADIRDEVLAGYLDEQRRILDAQSFERLRANYRILLDGDGQ